MSEGLLGAILSVNETQLAEAASKTATPDYTGVYVLGGIAAAFLVLGGAVQVWEAWSK